MDFSTWTVTAVDILPSGMAEVFWELLPRLILMLLIVPIVVSAVPRSQALPCDTRKMIRRGAMPYPRGQTCVPPIAIRYGRAHLYLAKDWEDIVLDWTVTRVENDKDESR